MIVLLGPEKSNKFTIELEYIYEKLLQDDDETSYAIILVSKTSKHTSDLIFGKYDSVDKNILERIQIKYIEKYDELIKFFDDLLFISRENLPSLILLERINLFFNMFINSQRRENYFYNVFIKLQSILERLSSFKDNIRFICSYDLEVNFVNQLDKYEYSIYDIFALYFGKDMIFYIDQDQDKFIKISKLESIIEINGANFDNKLKLNDLHALEPGLKEHFSLVEKKINEYYEELNEKS